MSGINTKRSVTVVLLVVTIVTIGISTGPHGGARAQMIASNVTGSQNQTKMMTGPNITGSIALGPILAKAIASQVHVSLANASTTAEKAVGAYAHAVAVRIGVVHGFLVYMALVVDIDNNFHGVIIDPGNGKVLSSSPMSMEQMMLSGMGINLMGPGMMGPTLSPGPGIMGPNMLFLQPRQLGAGMMGPQTAVPVPGMMGPGMSGYGAGMMQHGLMKGPGTIIMRHP